MQHPTLNMFLQIHTGVPDPPDTINASSNCSEEHFKIFWNQPLMLSGTKLTKSSICVDETCLNVDGDKQNVTIPFPSKNTTLCGSSKVCVSVENRCGLSNSSCTPVSIGEGNEISSIHYCGLSLNVPSSS